MKDKVKNIIIVALSGLMLMGMSAWCIFGRDGDFSESERRALKQMPGLSLESVTSGKFMNEFEEYSLDQFPLRDGMRSVKALSEKYLFAKPANNGLYTVDGYSAKMEYPLNEKMLDHAGERFAYIYDTYLKENECRVYLSIVPDKHYFLGKANGYLSMDYNALTEGMRERMDYAEYIDIFPLLNESDYYRTDTHWKQENILPVAEKLADAMDVNLTGKYSVETVDAPFYGVYYGQMALPAKPDELKYLTNDVLKGCTVTCYDTGRSEEAELYDMTAAEGRDPYEMFLSGTKALLTVNNPAARTDRELVVFRDSFGSSLIPLLAEGYSRITVVDIRYIRSDMLGNFVEFEGKDVLYLYSTLILNNSLALK